MFSYNEDGIDVNESRDLCDTPAVDETYMAKHHARVKKFREQQSKKMKKHLSHERLTVLERLSESMRQDRSKLITFLHRTIIDMVAFYLNLDFNEVLEGVLDSQHHLDLIADLLRARGRGAILFMYSRLPIPQDSGREFGGDVHTVDRVMVMDGSTYALTGKAVMVYRIKKEINIDSNNISEELMYTSIEGGKNLNVVQALEGALSCSVVEPIRTTSNLGELNAKERKLFLENLTSFQNFLASTNDNLRGNLRFEMPEEVVEIVSNHPSFENIMRSAPESGQKLVNAVKIWYKTIEQVLQDANCMRQEVNDRGPKAESEYWRSWLTKFSTILDFAAFDIVLKVLTMVKSSRSSYVMNWSTLLSQVEASLNEASDNVRYLDDFNTLSKALYITPAPELQEHLCSILNSVRLMYGYSRYFNTPERANTLLDKVANQVITSFREYLTDSFSKSIWNIPKKEVIVRMQICLNVYKNYRKFFYKMQQSSMKDENGFRCSEANVFVRLASFCARLEKIQDVLQTYLDLSILQSSCLDGVEKLTEDLEKYFKSFIMTTDDPLDERKVELDEAYKAFKIKMIQFEDSIRTFCKNLIDMCPTVQSALSMLERIDALDISCLCLDIEYLKVLQNFQTELCSLRDRYNVERENVPILLGLPPFASRIAWSRDFLYKIEEVFNAFKKRNHVITHPRAQPAIRQYNSFSAVLLQYENDHLSAWCQHLLETQKMLEVPVFHLDQTKMLKLNWSPYFDDAASEIATMLRMGLPVPDEIAVLLVNFDSLMLKRDRLTHLIGRYNSIKRSIPSMYLTMIASLLHNLDSLLHIGFGKITWISLDVFDYCDQVEATITELGFFMDKIDDLSANRVDASLRRISETPLIDLSSSEPLYPNQFLKLNEKRHKVLVAELNNCIIFIENTTIEIINKFVEVFPVTSQVEMKTKWLDPAKIFDYSDSITDLPITDQLAFRRVNRPKEDDLPRFHNDCMRVYGSIFKRLVDALIASVVMSLEALRSRITEDNSNPFLTADLKLLMPNVRLSPSLNEIQTAIISLAQETLHIFKELTMWGERKEVIEAWSIEDTEGKIKPPRAITNFFKLIFENKEVVWVVQSIQGCTSIMEPDITRTIEIYLEHKFLWEENRTVEINNFMDTDPEFYTIEDYVRRLEKLSHLVMNLPQFHNIYCVQVKSG